MNKKAQGISINTIIIAAIALIVLVVLVAIFTGRLGIFGREVGEVGQECAEFKNAEGDTGSWMMDSCPAGYDTIYTATDSDEHPGEACCLIEVEE
jgi:hypothetical protein